MRVRDLHAVPNPKTFRPISPKYLDVHTLYDTKFSQKLPKFSKDSHVVSDYMENYLKMATLPKPNYNGVNSNEHNIWISLFKMFKKPKLDINQLLWARAKTLSYQQVRIALETTVCFDPEIVLESTPGAWWKHHGFRTKDDVLNTSVFWIAHAQCASGQRPYPPYVVSGKRELLSTQELLEDKIRTFLIEPLELLYENKFLFANQDENIKTYQPGFIRYGINFHNGGFDRMIKESMRDIWVMADVSKWDRQLAILRDIEAMRTQGLKTANLPMYLEIKDRLERAQEAYVNHKILLPNGDVVEFDWGQVSGSQKTTSNNCLAHNTIECYLLLKACPDATDEMVLDQGSNLYSDDKLCSYTTPFMKMADEEFLSSAYSDFGLTIKEGSMKVSKSPIGMEFLGATVRAINYNDNVFFVPAYKRERVLAGLQMSIEPIGSDDEIMKALSLLQLGWYDCYTEIESYIKYLFEVTPDTSVKRAFLRRGIPTRDQIMMGWAGFNKA